jgi:Domain of unknown function (DUF4158)
MPTDVLTSEQRARYNTFVDEPSLEEISRYFYLDERDRALVRTYHGEANQLGFAVQRIALRYLGTFLEDIRGIPSGILYVIADDFASAHSLTDSKHDRAFRSPTSFFRSIRISSSLPSSLERPNAPLGRPSIRPLALAAANPPFVRSEIRSLSTSANSPNNFSLDSSFHEKLHKN